MKNRIKAVCVFCSSSDAVDSRYRSEAAALGEAIARNGYSLVFGGVDVGLMGVLAHAVLEHGAKVVGVIPSLIRDRGIAFEEADELIVTGDLRERKAVMESISDAFVALPGGFGTLDEIMDVLTRKQLALHQKPIALINIDGYFKPLAEQFELMYGRNFAKGVYRQLLRFVDDAGGLMEYLKSYMPPVLETKWF